MYNNFLALNNSAQADSAVKKSVRFFPQTKIHEYDIFPEQHSESSDGEESEEDY